MAKNAMLVVASIFCACAADTAPIEYVHYPSPGEYCQQLPAAWVNRTGWATPKEAYDRQDGCSVCCEPTYQESSCPAADKQWLPGTCASVGKDFESGWSTPTSKDPALGCSQWCRSPAVDTAPIEYVHFPADGGYCSQLPAAWLNRTGWATPKEAYDNNECQTCDDDVPADKKWIPGTCLSAGAELETGWGGSKDPAHGCTQWCHDGGGRRLQKSCSRLHSMMV